MSRLHLVGCASGVAGADEHSGDGPLVIQQSEFLAALKNNHIDVHWEGMVIPEIKIQSQRLDQSIATLCTDLAGYTNKLTEQNKFFTVIGGDHSCAIGTWSGVQEAMKQEGDLGLIWIDAHMDSHTPETSPSGRIHGMPLACLLGYGFETLTSILNESPKIKPQNLCLIGVRSYESGEAELLKRLNVRIFYMEEVLSRGVHAVMQEAIEIVTQNTAAYGLTLDIDALDPVDAPGVDVPEANGIKAADIFREYQNIISDKRLIATEIVEFDPTKDKNKKTEKIVVDLLKIISQRN